MPHAVAFSRPLKALAAWFFTLTRPLAPPCCVHGPTGAVPSAGDAGAAACPRPDAPTRCPARTAPPEAVPENQLTLWPVHLSTAINLVLECAQGQEYKVPPEILCGVSPQEEGWTERSLPPNCPHAAAGLQPVAMMLHSARAARLGNPYSIPSTVFLF